MGRRAAKKGGGLTYLPNAITVLRVLLTAALLFPLTGLLAGDRAEMPPGLYLLFGLIYLSDVLDGAAARGLKAQSAAGAVLDISADGLFIFSTLSVLIVFRVLPVWYGVFVLADFLFFLLTSGYIKRATPAAVFVFDLPGKIAAVVFYLIPALAFFAYSHAPYLPFLRLLPYISVVPAAVSAVRRAGLCRAAKRSKRPAKSYNPESFQS
ncbi:CDP-diacylglycerol--glycerol-3-phosphate 3-phosphatidyltransferase [Sporobacter termitidis DSM 10068]|uniref:CDP-diacylglycerol--glycerol-3-phosphate 3-phosphatidyltransferase n=1 Tax=Sporobacter termitidis DSM 10068 TaxID=1123282 RepID=A0A1M5WHX6_9FIRM|nr:CDP-diacylglycerol--glycerol-3-phosphate 3-phosphatidyltransferase [Sporobacter termitidis DSM 10068]